MHSTRHMYNARQELLANSISLPRPARMRYGQWREYSLTPHMGSKTIGRSVHPSNPFLCLELVKF
jgi:hypothetical protein